MKKKWGEFPIFRVICGRCNKLAYTIQPKDIHREKLELPLITQTADRKGKPIKLKQEGEYVYYICDNCGARVVVAELNFRKGVKGASGEADDSKWFMGRFVIK